MVTCTHCNPHHEILSNHLKRHLKAMQKPKKRGRPKQTGPTLKEFKKMTSAKAIIAKYKQKGWIPIYGKDPRKVEHWINPDDEPSIGEDELTQLTK